MSADSVDLEFAARARASGLPPPQASPRDPDRAKVHARCLEEYRECLRRGILDCDEELQICPEIH